MHMSEIENIADDVLRLSKDAGFFAEYTVQAQSRLSNLQARLARIQNVPNVTAQAAQMNNLLAQAKTSLSATTNYMVVVEQKGGSYATQLVSRAATRLPHSPIGAKNSGGSSTKMSKRLSVFLDGKKLAQPDTLQEAAKMTNPKYKESVASWDEKYTHNCARVVQAYELRRRGYDVEANAQNTEDQRLRIYANNWVDSETGKLGFDLIERVPNGILDTQKYIETQMLSDYEDGARGFIRFTDIGKASGHVINWEVQGREVIWVDAQSNAIGPQNFFTHWKDHMWLRTDHLTPTEQILDYLKDGNI